MVIMTMIIRLIMVRVMKVIAEVGAILTVSSNDSRSGERVYNISRILISRYRYVQALRLPNSLALLCVDATGVETCRGPHPDPPSSCDGNWGYAQSPY